MNRLRQVSRGYAHFNCQNALADQITGAGTDFTNLPGALFELRGEAQLLGGGAPARRIVVDR